MSSIKKCTCQHEYQDRIYGKGKRVHNWAPKHPNNFGGWRCTVCENVKPK